MITETTTLVLGAGASKPYGFPSGYELRQLLCDSRALYGMCALGFEQRDLDAFSTTFLKSGMPSIDAFLARRGEHKIGTLTGTTYADIGKAAIAYRLIQSEKPETLLSASDDHWYQYLWSFMADSLESFGENKLRIITFNYDRSLEYYLMTALQHSFGISSREAAVHLKKIPILHVYGQLAQLPELSANENESRPYFAEILHPAHLAVAARGIRIIDESRDDDVFDEAYSYLNEAERVCFLGFGFDPTNTRRLRLDDLTQSIRSNEERRRKIKFFATTFRLEAAERDQIIRKLLIENVNILDTNPPSMNIKLYGGFKIEQYLRATGVFISQ